MTEPRADAVSREELAEALRRLMRAADSREATMGDVSDLIEAQGELRAASDDARTLLDGACGAPSSDGFACIRSVGHRGYHRSREQS